MSQLFENLDEIWTKKIIGIIMFCVVVKSNFFNFHFAIVRVTMAIIWCFVFLFFLKNKHRRTIMKFLLINLEKIKIWLSYFAKTKVMT